MIVHLCSQSHFDLGQLGVKIADSLGEEKLGYGFGQGVVILIIIILVRTGIIFVGQGDDPSKEVVRDGIVEEQQIVQERRRTF